VGATDVNETKKWTTSKKGLRINGVIDIFSRHFRLTEETHETSVGIFGDPAEVSHERLPNMSEVQTLEQFVQSFGAAVDRYGIWVLDLKFAVLMKFYKCAAVHQRGCKSLNLLRRGMCSLRHQRYLYLQKDCMFIPI
jgi:hypothetical protein